MENTERLPQLEDDGLPIADVGSWSEEKYRLVAHYASMFVRSMRKKWDTLVYLDLFASSGRAKFRGTNNIVAASPLMVLGLSDVFDHYIFCEKNRDFSGALETRCSRDFPNSSVTVVPGDANTSTGDILAKMPKPGRGRTSLGLCFLDPFNMSNLQFSTIRSLSERFMDFLILLPSGVRNEHNYVKSDNMILSGFLGTDDWRVRWKEKKKDKTSFEHFVVEEFGRSMKGIGYIDPGLESTALIRTDEKNLPLYRLALYSKHPLGNKFWNDAKKYTTPQLGLEF